MRFHNTGNLTNAFFPQAHTAHVCCWAETAAMLQQFKSFKAALAPHRHMVFGAPMPKRNNMHIGVPAGTAACALKPFSIQLDPLVSGPMFIAGRYMVLNLFLPTNVLFKLVVIYGFQGKSQSATTANETLF